MAFKCEMRKCGKTFTKKRNWISHAKNTCKYNPAIQSTKKRGKLIYRCPDCASLFRTKKHCDLHRNQVHAILPHKRKKGPIDIRNNAASSTTKEHRDREKPIHPPQYQKIRKNRAIKPVKFKKSVELGVNTDCVCNAYDEDPCGPQSKCINYSSSTECGAKCEAGIRCQNQNFSRAIYPKLQLKHFGL